MRKLPFVFALIVFSVVTFIPDHTADAAQVYYRWAPGLRMSCTQVGGSINIVVSSRAVQYSNPDDSPAALYTSARLVNGTSVFTGGFMSIPNGVDTLTLSNYSTSVSGGYPLEYTFRYDTYIGITRIFRSEVVATCNGNASNIQMSLKNSIPGTEAFRRWQDNKTATCSLGTTTRRIQFNNLDVEYGNPLNDADYTRTEIDDDTQITGSGPNPVEFGSGSVSVGGVLYVTISPYPLDYRYTINTYDEDGAFIYRSVLRATCAGSSPAIVSVTDTVITDANRASVQSTLVLQGRPPAPHSTRAISVRATLTVSGSGAPIADLILLTTDTGLMTLSGQAPGTYRLYVKGTSTLAVKTIVTLVAGTNTITLPVLREGDANNDNTVNITDFSSLAAAFGSVAGGGTYNANADFNKDGVVNITDFSLLASSFGQSGAA
ncbi:MAG: dockerin type I domain-containing protein [Chloroflexota bacterium]|nr:dockerin type I domain-containing protein [Chloroflexota bacterium]